METERINRYLDWGFRGLIVVVISVAAWQGQRVFNALDDHDKRLQKQKNELIEHRATAVANMATIRSDLTEIKASQREISRRIDSALRRAP